MKKREVLKLAVGSVVSIGVSSIISNIIKSTTPKGIGKWKAICIVLGGFVLSMMVSGKAETYVEERIDAVAKAYDGTLDEVKEEIEKQKNK